MSPVSDSLNGTRLAFLAGSYQKYRYRRLVLKIASNFSTTVGGNIIAGYSENPEMQLLDGGAVFNQLFAMNGVSTSLFTPVNITGRIGDKNKWYNIDEDSAVIMDTTQGVFFVALQSAVTVTGTQTIPIMIEYDIEFKEPAVQTAKPTFQALQVWEPAGVIQRKDETRGQYHVETNPLTVNNIYRIPEGVKILTKDGPEIAFWVAHFDNNVLSHGFYKTRQDCISAQNQIVSNIGVGGSLVLPASIKIEQLN
jgi:hypothetical protein